jgi:uncharacterized protein
MANFYDIDRSFALDSKGDIAILTDADAIHQSINTAILTATGAKVGDGPVNSVYGVGINKYLFAPLSEFTGRSLGESIFRHLTIFEPRLEVQKINVSVGLVTASFDVTLSYTIKGSAKVYTYRTVINQI